MSKKYNNRQFDQFIFSFICVIFEEILTDKISLYCKDERNDRNTMIYDKLENKQKAIAVVGLGYVGMPIAVSFAKKAKVIGYDRNTEKVEAYLAGEDPTNEVGNQVISETSVEFTSNPERLKEASFIIVAVPTPVNQDKTPDLTPVEEASRTIGRYMAPGTIVVYESTVYPGVTETICVPILEQESGFTCGSDFKVGYSPERINPGDRVHRLEKIKKIVAGMDQETTEEIKAVYDMIIDAGTFAVSNIKTAEAVKVVENSQRDINIAFMNELAMVFDRMGIDTNEVVDGMNTKWNALGFRPGLVGGHCIGVDPYYFTYEAEKLGYHSQIILAGRKVNDSMGGYIADSAIKQMVLAGKTPKTAKTVIFGLTFKEDCPDIRNSKVEDIIKRLREYGIKPLVVDPWADPKEAERVYQVSLTTREEIQDADCIIFAVAHEEFKQLGIQQVCAMFGDKEPKDKILIDVKGTYSIDEIENTGIRYWRL